MTASIKNTASLKTALFALPFAAVLALGTMGCANETAAEEEVAAESESQTEQVVEDYAQTRAYQFASKRLDDVLDEIIATDEQRATANAIKDRFAKDMFSMRDDRKEIRAEIMQEWKKDNPDTEAMHDLVDERIEVYRKMLHEMVDGASEIHGTLTPEQRALIAVMAEERMKNRERFGHR